MQKIIIITVFILLIAILILQPFFASADEYDRDEAFVSWKLMAYAIYPVGYAIENIIVKPGHWFLSLPYLRNISGHEELSKSLVSKISEEDSESYENLKSSYQTFEKPQEEKEKEASKPDETLSLVESISDNAKKSAKNAKSAAESAEDSALQSEDSAKRAEEAASKADIASKKAETIFEKMIKK